VIDAEPLEESLASSPHAVRAPVGRVVAHSVRIDHDPNLVAISNWSRRPAMARPTSYSLVYAPQTSAVSRNVIPRSSARWIVATSDSSSPAP